MRRALALIGLFMMVAAPAMAAAQTQAATAAGGPLDGTRWTVKVTPDAAAMAKGEKIYDDVINFDGGYVAMGACVKSGFSASRYGTIKSDGAVSFMTEQTSKKEGKTHWTADIAGDAIKGKVVWTKQDGTVLNYTFEGKKAGA